ncbi:neurogenic differentiation factor 1-like [Pollicipes pollicipes]|uniref:neurogenic differentiation factor 1-like n=1 Tax=Pollicipes pollicipes TaxID=41117 RepID=UPI001884E353|nr:neurogenic differentiation factor 1-like [Pollicipes pollicipes]
MGAGTRGLPAKKELSAGEDAEVSSTTGDTAVRRQQPATTGRTAQNKAQRTKANARERTRMHGLNAALDTLRRHIPFARSTSKLSKIETLRMARNYIYVLAQTLATGEPFDLPSYACVMARGLSQATANQINGSLNLRPRSIKLLPPLEPFRRAPYVSVPTPAGPQTSPLDDHVLPEPWSAGDQLAGFPEAAAVSF